MATEQEPVKAVQHLGETSDFALSDKPEYPGQTLGVVALVLSFFLQIPALIMGIIAWV